MDNTQLEDLIEFHELKPDDYYIRRGYVWFNVVYNTKINSVIKDLYQKRY